MKRYRYRTWASALLALGLMFVPGAAAWAIDPIEIEYLWQSQPTLAFDWFKPPVRSNIHIGSAQVNAAPVRERMHAMQSIVRVPLSPTLDRPGALKLILQRLADGESHRVVRLELISAACELDDGQNAAALWKLAENDEEACAIVERACIGWRSPLPIARWRDAVKAEFATEQRLLQAIDGLAAVGTNDDVALLTPMVLDGTRTSTLRLACARAIGSIATDDQLPLAKQLEKSNAEHPQLLAVEVLARSPAETTTEYVQQLALHAVPLAQRSAYRWLCQRDAATAQRLVGDFLSHADPAIRLMALQQLTLAQVSDTLPKLFAAFADEHPQVRKSSRLHVLSCCTRSEDELQKTKLLLQQSMAAEDWRVLEQSIRLTVELNEKQYCERHLVLVTHERPEVCIAAGWALRNLGDDEAMLASMLEYVKQLTERLARSDYRGVSEAHLRAAAHLLEAFGHRKYAPAKDTVIRFVPKTGFNLILRMTGIWSCGRLWENSKNTKLTDELHARIADKASMTPELESLRFAATLALGWIADPDSREPLILNNEPQPAPIGYATEWALNRIEKK